jgi:tetratricopeptide (TPR) repeat protein
MKNKIAKLFLILLFLTGFAVQPLPSKASEASWNELNLKAIKLYQQGRYSEAVKIAADALTVAEKTFGPDHPNTAASLNNLAERYRAQGKYAEAEPLYKRSLEIMGKALGPNHPNVVTVMGNMAKCYREMGKEDEARRLESRAKQIRSRQ